MKSDSLHHEQKKKDGGGPEINGLFIDWFQLYCYDRAGCWLRGEER